MSYTARKLKNKKQGHTKLQQEENSQIGQEQSQMKIRIPGQLSDVNNNQLQQSKTDYLIPANKINICIWALGILLLVIIFTSIFCGIIYAYHINQSKSKTQASQQKQILQQGKNGLGKQSFLKQQQGSEKTSNLQNVADKDNHLDENNKKTTQKSKVIEKQTQKVKKDEKNNNAPQNSAQNSKIIEKQTQKVKKEDKNNTTPQNPAQNSKIKETKTSEVKKDDKSNTAPQNPTKEAIKDDKNNTTLKNTAQNSKIIETKTQVVQQKQDSIQAQQVEETYNDFGIKYNTLSEVPANRRVTVTITSCCGRVDLLNITLASFFKKSTFPYDQIILIQDGQLYQELIDVLALYKEHNITVIATGKKVGQIKATDMMYAWVQTPYIFHFQDDWEFLKKGFIQESFGWLQNDTRCVQPWIQKHNLPFIEGTRRPKTSWSISMNPGLRRFSDYKQMGTYGEYTSNGSYGTGAGAAEWYISNYYVKRGRYCIETQTQYTRHLGNGRGGQRYKGKIQLNPKK